jgi:acetyl esterase/lipase
MINMPLTPESRSFLQEMKDLEALHLTSETQKKFLLCKNYAGDPEFVPIVNEYSFSSKYDGATIRTRFYKPSTLKLPLIIYAHGGGWVYGNLDSHDALCRRLALRTNCSVLSIDYRLAPKHKFPTAINDFQSVYEWVSSNKIDFQVLNDSIIFGGDSSGACIAAATTCRLIKEKKILPVNLILITPVLDLSFTSKKMDDFELCYLLTKEILQSYVVQYTEPHHDVTYWMLSPFFFDEFKHFPKTLVVTAECDILCEEGKLFSKKIAEKGVSVEYFSFRGVLHGFINCHSHIPEAETALNLIKKHLQPRLSSLQK